MAISLAKNVVDLPELRDLIAVFRDRNHGGEILAEMVRDHTGGDAAVMAIPAGGVPVAKVMAERLNLSLYLAVVSKITLPWNTEAGYGAVAFDGTVRLNDNLVARFGLTKKQIQEGIAKTSQKVAKRVKSLGSAGAWSDFSGQEAILVDDGLASGFTMLVAIEALKKTGIGSLKVAVPTGYERSIRRIASEIETLYCANIRGGFSFAVADAYLKWSDLGEDEVATLLADFQRDCMKD
ncbi:MAG: phosphoribosyltransferase [Deltaproteobacteria bacterium]|nr:phosphoribosyltransferase [Deltaproteobacteria bacterium]